ncbi:hypothetical protein CMV30_05955 [Nibricoccus aquaticus]|uniref:DUF2249 domain-containing protein n=1 Tax=Nibricoccus aquaticus TaxID=2576891 RepID=A0A290Q4W2_9BACT|nr:DUF2249 domain-containing protein [Nibricoccus aquaticus]ATC63534.1 hypothetical protein CMV30_05955 [Nibricoccus aquaticus]
MSGAPKDRVMDVRPLIAEGIEPRPQLFAAVKGLAAGQALVVIAPFLPSPLIERLKADGFSAEVTRRGDGAWEVRFAPGEMGR